MPDSQAEVRIPARPETVYHCLTDPSALARWIAGLKASEPITTGGLERGARSREVVETGGQESLYLSEVLEVEPDRRLVVRTTSRHGTVDTTYRLDPVGPAETLLVVTLRARYRGWARLLAPFIAGPTWARVQEDLRRLAELAGGLEQGGAESVATYRVND